MNRLIYSTRMIYAESSAVPAWLLAQPEGHAAGTALEHADLVTTSDLTLLE
jgi:hypothetical protein